MNPLRYLVFCIMGGVVAMLAQVAVSPRSTVPDLGASGAIAAVMGAFLVTYPRDHIKSVLFIGWFVAKPLKCLSHSNSRDTGFGSSKRTSGPEWFPGA